MAVFAYQGTNRAGTVVKGEQTATTKAEATNILRRQQINVTKISEKGKEFTMPTFGGSVSAKELAIFTRQFSVMIDAGLPLVQCLELIANQQDNKHFQKILHSVRSAVEGGATLSAAMRPHIKVFDTLYVNMIEAGETGGILDTILQRLSAYIEKNVKLKSAVKSALIYPVSVMGIAVGVVGLLLWKVVPIFAKLFEGLGVALPTPTKIVMGLSAFVGSIYGAMVVVVFVGVMLALKVWYATPAGRRIIDTVMLKIPVIGMILRKIAVARFTRTLGTLISSGVPILEGLDITARTSGNAVVEEALMKVRAAVEGGRNLQDPLKETEIFPNMVVQMVGVGEQTGAMDAMLSKVADFYEDEVDAAIKNMLTLMEPMMIAFLGVAVGGIVISLYLPLFELIGKLAG